MADSINRSNEGGHREVTVIFETQADIATIDTHVGLAAENWFNPLDFPGETFDSLSNAQKGSIITKNLRAYIKQAAVNQKRRDAREALDESTAFDPGA